VRIHVRWVPCYHCEKPICIDKCPTDAMYKEDKYGAVLIDRDKCNGCRLCYKFCPYGAPVFESDARKTVAQKCDMCIDRLERGELPACALSCGVRALDFGPLQKLEERYGTRCDLPDLPDSGLTAPSVVFKPAAAKRQILPYDASRALELLMRRDPLPEVYPSPAAVTDIPPGIVGRDKLIIKHKSAAELLRATRNDDG